MSKSTAITAKSRAEVSVKVRKTSKKTPSVKVANYRAGFSDLGATWSALEPTIQAAWADQTALLSDPKYAAVAQPNLNPYQFFVSTNLVLGPFGGPLQSYPFPEPILPVAIGTDIVVNAASGSAGLILTLTSLSDIPGKFAIYASAPQLSTRVKFADKQCALIMTVESLTSDTPLALQDAYLKVYRKPAPNWKIAIQVASVSPTGLRLPRKTFPTVVSFLPAQAAPSKTE